MNGKEVLKKLRNTGTVIAVASFVVLILTTNGLDVDSEKVMVTVKSLCSVLVLLGIMNSTDTPGMDIPFLKKGDK